MIYIRLVIFLSQHDLTSRHRDGLSGLSGLVDGVEDGLADIHRVADKYAHP